MKGFQILFPISCWLLNTNALAQSQYAYDKVNRLIEVKGNCISSFYTYDDNGNRKTKEEYAIYPSGNVTNEKCPRGNDGEILISTSDPSIAYKYIWNTGATGAHIANLAPGKYTVTIQDPAGKVSCSKEYKVVAKATVDSLQIVALDVNCFGGKDGSAKVNIVVPDQAASYKYKWDSSTDTAFTTSSGVGGLMPGTYSVKIRNGYSSCEQTLPFIIKDAPKNILGFESKPNKCFRQSNASVSVNVDGNSSQYSYRWTSTSMAATKTTQQIASLPGGTYTIEVTEIGGSKCVETDSIKITDPEKMIAGVTHQDNRCNETSNGSASVSVPGFGWTYTYNWSGPTGSFNSKDIRNIKAGTYIVTVSDNVNGCVEKDTVVVKNYLTSLIDSVRIQKPTCILLNDGIAEADMGGGLNEYSYNWYSISDNVYLNIDEYRVPVNTGSYRLIATENNQYRCKDTSYFEVPDPLLGVEDKIVYPNPTTGIVTIVLCTDLTVSPRYTISNMSGQVLRAGIINSTQSGLANFDLSGFPAGQYLITFIMETVTGKPKSFKVIKI